MKTKPETRMDKLLSTAIEIGLKKDEFDIFTPNSASHLCSLTGMQNSPHITNNPDKSAKYQVKTKPLRLAEPTLKPYSMRSAESH
ncbi:5987_t:CDS:2 [Dentiscutata erythropus]|uniref:5987_t:CDS:1 n=1 Tax=Dentiscutata erythropus TaxID=1348616 RepID=A0A9N9B3D0_9GLOM|nr:5987_t:CDS:2 [Dentiscutata erythropus]